MTVTYYPIIPVWGIIVALVALLALLIHGSFVLKHRRVPRPWILGLATLRCLALALFAGCLLRPVVTVLRTETWREDLLILADVSASMGNPDGPNAGRLAKALAEARDHGFTTAMNDAFDVRWFAFDDQSREVEDVALDGLTTTAPATSFARSIATACLAADRHRLAAGNVLDVETHVLLITDGLDRGSAGIVETAREHGVTLHTLAVADPVSATDSPSVQIIGVQSPPRVLLGSQSRFHVSLRRSGREQQSVSLRLHENDTPILDHAVTFKPGQQELEVDLPYQPTRAGDVRYSLQLCDGNTASPCDDGPSHATTVEVRDHPYQVLMLEETWRWNFRFLRHLFENDPGFSFTAFLRRDTGTYLQVAERDGTVAMAGFPRSAADLKPFDIIVLGDVRSDRWAKALAPAIHEQVVTHGRSLVVIAGPNLLHWQQTPELEALLPVDLSEVSGRPLAGPIHVQITDQGTSPIFASPQTSSGSSVFSDLPPLDQIYPPIRKRPAASILLQASDHRNEHGPFIVVAEHTVGRGRVLFIGTDTLWKWHLLGRVDDEGNTAYRVFWQQALRIMAPERSFDHRPLLRLRTERGRYTAGQTVHLLAEPTDENPSPTVDIVGNMVAPDGREMELAFQGDPVRPHLFTTMFQVLDAGPHKVQVAVKSDDQVVAEAQAIVEVDASRGHEEPVATDRALLQRIATATGGRAINPPDPTTWPKPHHATPRTVQTARTIDLWSGFHLVLLLVAILTVDWILRLVRGFV